MPCRHEGHLVQKFAGAWAQGKAYAGSYQVWLSDLLAAKCMEEAAGHASHPVRSAKPRFLVVRAGHTPISLLLLLESNTSVLGEPLSAENRTACREDMPSHLNPASFTAKVVRTVLEDLLE